MSNFTGKITLASFRICPFVVRSQIVAFEKNINVETIYIDLSNKPQWFVEKSPTQTVPALLVDDNFIFESAVICDFIDSLTESSLYPQDRLLKYVNKSWIEYASTLIFSQYGLCIAIDDESLRSTQDDFSKKLLALEKFLSGSRFFNGIDFSIIDASYAPMLYRMQFMQKRFNDNTLDTYPKIAKWAEVVCQHPSVKEFLNEDFDNALLDHMAEEGSILVCPDKTELSA